jgi:hypothetical protein
MQRISLWESVKKLENSENAKIKKGNRPGFQYLRPKMFMELNIFKVNLMICKGNLSYPIYNTY